MSLLRLVKISGYDEAIERYVEDGKAFSHNSKRGLDAAASIDHYLLTPATPTIRLASYEISGTGGPLDNFLYEAASITAAGTTATVLNYDRNRTAPAAFSLYTGPTVAATGSEIKYVLIPAAKGEGGFGLANGGLHTVLKPSTKYLFRTTNNNNATISVSVKFIITEGEIL